MPLPAAARAAGGDQHAQHARRSEPHPASMRHLLVLSLAAVVGATAPEALLNSGKIEHFVVLYMENRVRCARERAAPILSCALSEGLSVQ